MKGPTSHGSRIRITSLPAVLALTCCAHNSTDPAPPSVAVPLEPYRIGPGDIVEISVWRHKAMSRTMPVRPDGMVSLPLLNDVTAAGLTPTQLRQVLTERLSRYITEPEVSVIVREVHSTTVTVYGEVKNPGQYLLQRPTRLLELLARVGGPTEYASGSEVFILRQGKNGTQRFRVSYEELMYGDEGNNPYLLAGDILVMP